MSFRVSPSIQKLVPYVPGKPIEETQREFGLKRVVKLASNENPLGASPQALRAVKSSLKELHRYPDASGYRLKQKISKSHRIGSDEIVLGNGSNEVIDLLIRSFCEPGDQIATFDAAFIAYSICAQVHGVSTVRARNDAQLVGDADHLVELVENSPRVRMVFIAQPNNPTGTYLGRSAFENLLTRLSRIRGGSVMVVVDSAYTEYVTVKDFVDPMKLRTKFPELVVLRTFSKIYGLAGLRVGYGVASREVISVLERVRMPFNLSNLALVAAEHALDDRTFMKKSREVNARGLKLWSRELNKMKVPFWPSQGNFLLADARAGFGLPGFELFQACLRQGLILRPVTNYGLPDAIRISIGTDSENKFAISVLKKIQARSRK
jgi:histidinol-phosphate aminotransferase